MKTTPNLSPCTVVAVVSMPCKPQNMKNTHALVIALIATTFLIGLPLKAAVITFNGASTPLSSQTVDLTASGTTDWVKYGISTWAPPIYFASMSVATNISDATGATALNAIGGNQPTFTWSNGASPDPTGSDNWGFRGPGGVPITFTLATANTTNNVSVWFGAFNGTTGTFQISLTGATTYVNSSSFVFDSGDKVMRYDFTLTPDTIGDVATFSWVTDGSGILSAATLSAVPEPSVGVLVGVAGAIALLLRRCRRVEN